GLAPRTKLERDLCELWRQLLRVERVGIRDNFFELGGHSLLAVRLFSEVERLLGRKFPLITIFEAPTVEQLANVVQQQAASAANSLLVPIQPRGTKPPLFLIHGAGGDVLWGYANLAAHLPSDQPVYGIKSRGQAGLDEFRSLREMAAGYLDVVRELQPHGPYFLGGYCFGGNVAYEMARQFEAQGEKVALVALLDSAPANAGYESVPWWRPSFAWRFGLNACAWLKDFAALSSADRRGFVGRKLRAIGRKLKRRWKGNTGAPTVDIEEVIDPRHFPERELRLWQIHLQELVEHVEGAFSGSVVLLRTRGQPLFCSLEPDFCWGRLARGGVTVRLIPGSHENVFMEPNVQTLGKELARALTQAQEQSAPAEPKPARAPESLVQSQ
ncbi:MAG TPA: alpha/beta fold hydrolase, partial [Verrucomicrobiae bacterium]|nr:alpha/beta fold hydrolase [Verrucomicrobiae bacterium]